MTTHLSTAPTGSPFPWARPDEPPSSPPLTADDAVAAPPPPTGPAPASAPPPADPGDRSRAGAVWVTGTGAALLVAAAAVFVAVQWDHLSNELKLGILASVTGACLLAGRRLRSALPATSGVIYHLGAFLIPANTAAIAMHQQMPWPQFLLLEGATATVAWTILNQVERSVVLRWATGAAVVVSAAGVGAVTHTPTPLLLAGCAGVAEGLRRHKEATAWALLAGLAPAVGLATAAVPPSARTLVEALGLAGPGAQLSAIATGMVAAVVLARNAQRRQDLVLVATAAVALLLGVTTAWVGVQPPVPVSLIGAAAVFLFIELAAHLVAADAFWAKPGHAFAVGAEALAVAATPVAICAAAWALVTGEVPQLATSTAAGTAGATAGTLAWSSLAAGVLAAVAWFVADLRRRRPDGLGTGYALLLGGGFGPTSVFAPLALLAGVGVATASIPAVVAVALALAALLVLSGRPFAHTTASCLVVAAVAVQGVHGATTASTDTTVAITTAAAALIGATVMASIAIIRSHMTDADQMTLAWCAAIGAVATLEIGWASLLRTNQFPVLVGLAAAAAALALLLDRLAATERTGPLGWVGRGAALFTLVQASNLPNEQLAVLAGVISLLIVADALLRRSPAVLYALALSLPVTVAAWAFAVPMSSASVGLTLCVAAATAAGVQLLVPSRWSHPILSVVLSCAAAGFGFSTASLSAAGTAMIIIAAIGLAYSAVGRSIEGLIASAVLATAGLWAHLAAANVTALDAYLAPVALGLLVAGGHARAQRAHDAAEPDAGSSRLIPAVGSWVAYGPGIIMLGGAALLERVQGGGGIHALVAGTVGVAALLAGGAKRLVAPLFLGTALLLALTLNESLIVTREVPTWGWLALGGTVLVGAGIMMERLDTGPRESGRRLVDVISQRYS